MSEILGRGEYLSLVREGIWEFVRRVNSTGVVAIYAYTDSDEIVLVEQPRAAVGTRVVEIPAGLVGDIPGEENESFAVAARRELEEETGFQAGSLLEVERVPSVAGFSSEMVRLYVARGLQRVGEGGGDETEEIEVHIVALAGLDAFLQERKEAGSLVDPKVYAASYFQGRMK